MLVVAEVAHLLIVLNLQDLVELVVEELVLKVVMEQQDVLTLAVAVVVLEELQVVLMEMVVTVDQE